MKSKFVPIALVPAIKLTGEVFGNCIGIVLIYICAVFYFCCYSFSSLSGLVMRCIYNVNALIVFMCLVLFCSDACSTPLSIEDLLKFLQVECVDGRAYSCMAAGNVNGDSFSPKWIRMFNEYKRNDLKEIEIGIYQLDMCFSPDDVINSFGNDYINVSARIESHGSSFRRFSGSKYGVMEYRSYSSVVEFYFFGSSCLFQVSFHENGAGGLK